MTYFFHFQRCGAFSNVNREIYIEACFFKAKQYGIFHVPCYEPEMPKVVRNVDYGLSDTRWKVVGLGRSEHRKRVVRMTLAKADTSTFKCWWAAVFSAQIHFFSKLHQGW
jgi:hypothetical protein